MTSSQATTSYDTLPYPPYSFPATHIGRLGAIGRLFGLQTADPAKARVLELGCGVGVNLLAMAQLFPDSDFVGVDASEKQIECGRQALEDAGIRNARLIAGDLSKIEEDLGKFDYILVHGLFSWVPGSVKDAILRIGGERLNPGGITYISYNCLPGWRMRGALRDMMIMHTDGIPDLLGKVAQAKALIKFLAESCSEETPYGKYLRQELDMLTKVDDSYIAHEFLETENDALYFRDFLVEAAKHGLGYLGDAEPSTMIVDNMPDKAAQTLKSLNLNLIASEQYMDFLRNRMFRSTLLCHASSPINRNIDPLVLQDFLVSPIVTLKQPHNGGQPAVFISPNGLEMSVSDSITAAILETVVKSAGAARPVRTLIDEVMPVLAENKKLKDDSLVPAMVCQVLMQAYFKKMVDFHTGVYSVAPAGSERPVALPLARWQAAHGHRLSTVYLAMLNADPFVAKLVTLCDGTRDRAAIIQALVEAVGKNEFTLQENNQPIADPERLKLVVESLYDGAVNNLGALGVRIPDAA
jgi:methyltransferase-like protein/SAM-dependent methyltransferase